LAAELWVDVLVLYFVSQVYYIRFGERQHMPIYTKTGDKGQTSLFGGIRVSKSELLVDAYGSVDELNSWIGLVITELERTEKKELLTKIQADLFRLGGSLAGWNSDLSSLQTRVTEMEIEIDAMEEQLPSLKNFILPGGNHAAATVHLARSVTRRVERQLVGLFQKKKSLDVNQEIIIQYVNRLSDLFFVLARFINNKHDIPDVTWSGIERKK
jgi:cob(I)alamin adenosyltransferase